MICLKLISGEEIMGMIDSVSEPYISITKPVTISFGWDKDGNYGLKMSLFMSYSDDELYTFDEKMLIIAVPPNEEMIALYNKYLDSIEKNSKDVEGRTFH